MRKLIFITAIYLCACSPRVPQPKGEENNESKPYGDFKLRVIDSCEYLEYDYGIFDQRVYSLTHKGNCRFCAERQAKRDSILFKITKP